MIYTDRHGRHWCRLNRDGIRVWVSSDSRDDVGDIAARAHAAIASIGETGDRVLVDGDLQRRRAGQNPHAMGSGV